ncbi:MAG: type I restriction enzyme HsdR N-terminal domain-containing protein [Oscillospiraceae bacterium]|nr:type I restriction enzyme HsdR N-terminal domain-containing protein [Oscillospiraceae bacterium]
MTATEKWNMLVEHHNKYLGVEERTVQSIWEKIFVEIFGYSSLAGEIESQRPIQIGSAYRPAADIIIRDDRTDLFVVELKRHDSLFNKKDEGQLLSYLKLLRNSTGILICNKIYVYTYDANKTDDEQKKAEIEFKQNSPDGIKFIELFNKATFQEKAVKKFVNQKIESAKNIGRIGDEITSELVIDLLRSYFADKYCAAESEQAIEEFNVTITPKKIVVATPINSLPLLNPLVDKKENLLTRAGAVELCSSNGLDVVGNFTLARRNKSGPYFWANPSITYLLKDWWLLLNDHRKNELHVFKIPANSIVANKVKRRNDKPNLMDMQIRCDDNSFQDTRSKTRFIDWFLKTIKY